MAINRMLCVDDEEGCREASQSVFQRRLTPNVDLAEDYESAMRQIRQNRYDLIVLDGLGGDCFRIHHDARDLPHGPIVILSSDSKIKLKAQQEGIPFYDKLLGCDVFDRIVSAYK